MPVETLRRARSPPGWRPFTSAMPFRILNKGPDTPVVRLEPARMMLQCQISTPPARKVLAAQWMENGGGERDQGEKRTSSTDILE
ncbi:protein FAM110A [Lates japonicus]|uniref:Protein FAM110A n=1 Tax=Lates japonicus TaxID=270547 RepID=A0AAD3NNB2_LATJO|nr:protein FAM110A [Lates japonicus]